MKVAIRCHCGQRISLRDVVQRVRVVRRFGSPMVYLRYRCSRCQKMGERYIKQDHFTMWSLLGAEPEVTPQERKRFDRMGPITEDEIARVQQSSADLANLQVAEDS